jgi:hypothetical protein
MLAFEWMDRLARRSRNSINKKPKLRTSVKNKTQCRKIQPLRVWEFGYRGNNLLNLLQFVYPLWRPKEFWTYKLYLEIFSKYYFCFFNAHARTCAHMHRAQLSWQIIMKILWLSCNLVTSLMFVKVYISFYSDHKRLQRYRLRIQICSFIYLSFLVFSCCYSFFFLQFSTLAGISR